MRTEETIDQLREQRECMTNIMIDMLACINSERENVKKLAAKQMSTTVTKKELLEAVAAHKAGRSAWSRGVMEYAMEMVESLDDSADLCNEVMLEKALLNGAGSWQEYSDGGCALVYDADIAERLCSPSELKRVKWGMRSPNGREKWLEVQARALWQAHRLIENEWRKLEGGAA